MTQGAIRLCAGRVNGPMYGPRRTDAECMPCKRRIYGLSMPQVMTCAAQEEKWSRAIFITPSTEAPCPNKVPV